MTEVDNIVARLRALAALDRPESGGPYGGYAASTCMEAMREAATALETLQRERDEAREALKPFAELGEVVLAEAPSDAVAAWSFKSSDGRFHLISLYAFRAAIAALPRNHGEGK